jgi:hypothetical protein
LIIGRYSNDEYLSKQQLQAVRCIAGNTFVLQQDSVSAFRARGSVAFFGSWKQIYSNSMD